MRTITDIDEELMRQAMLVSGKKTKQETVEAGLRLLIDIYPQTTIRRLKGKVRWEGDLANLAGVRSSSKSTSLSSPSQRRRTGAHYAGALTSVPT
jgi:Arc/MetJ family transcription regulator